jgi:hypothetical protein
MLTQQKLKELVFYCHERGGLFWINSPTPKSRIKIGHRAGSIDSHGHRQTSLFGTVYMEHRLVWFYHHGRWPNDQIDHVNGIRDDNRLENLRECNQSQNSQNQRKASKNNTSTGILGVSKHKNSSRFTSAICTNKKQIYLGTFDTPEEAHKAYVQAKRQHHPFGRL